MKNRAARPVRTLVTLSALLSVACEADKASPEGPTGPTLPPYTAKDERFDPTKVFAPAKTPPAISGGTLAVSPDGVVVAADADRDQVYLIDPARADVRTIELLPGDEPGRVLVDATQAFVALRGAGGLARIDLQTHTLTRAAVCSAPRGLSFSGKDALLVACSGGELVTLGLDGSERARFVIKEDLRDVGRDARGVWVSRYRTPALLRLGANGEVLSAQAPSGLSVLGAFDGSSLHEFSATLASRTIPTPEGKPLMLHQRAQTTPLDISTGTDGYGGVASDGCEAGIVHTTLSRFDEASSPLATSILPGSVVPVDVAVSPSGKQLAVVSPGSFSRQRAPAFSPSGGFENQSERPFSSVPGPTRQLALVMSTDLDEPADPARPCHRDATQAEHVFPGEAVAVAFVDDQTLVVQVREPAELRVLDIDSEGVARLSNVIDLSEISVLHTGHQLFHQAAGVNLACASCHGEGNEDGHVWNFRELGERRTQSLLDKVMDSAPFHWNGDIADLSGLMDEVFVSRMGGAPVSAAWTGALGTFLDALPERVHDAPARDAAAMRGESAFQKAECASCHFGAQYGRTGSFDVGTGGTFQVPSLVGLSTRLPLMHNGCALTLEDRFNSSCGGTRHGEAGKLSQSEWADLVAFLRTL